MYDIESITKHARFCFANCLQVTSLCILSELYDTVPMSLPRLAKWITKHDGQAILRIGTLEEVHYWVSDLSRRKYIVCGSPSTVRLMKASLHKRGCSTMPVYGLPKLGQWDLTTDGASVVRSYHAALGFENDDGIAAEVYHEHDAVVTVYATSEMAMQKTLADETMQIMRWGAIEKLGKWSDRWWRVFDSGYKTTGRVHPQRGRRTGQI